jgi:hypothetical protein
MINHLADWIDPKYEDRFSPSAFDLFLGVRKLFVLQTAIIEISLLFGF